MRSVMAVMRKLLFAGISIAMLAAPAGAADLSVTPVYKAPRVAPAPPATWNGFYAGINAGYGVSRFTNTHDFSGFPGAPLSPNGNGGVAGAQAGFNYQAGMLLLGLESDISYSDIKGRDAAVGAFTFTIDQRIKWFGTVRGRVGVLPIDSVLFYATGGVAYGGTSADASDIVTLPNTCFNSSCGSGSTTGTSAGWAAGAGIEARLGSNWSAKAEYLHLDLGGRSVTFPLTFTATVVNSNSKFAADIARFGLNYKFDWGTPVVTKY